VSDVVLLLCCFIVYCCISNQVYCCISNYRNNKNVHICHINRPDAISKFFAQSNTVDSHSQLRQGQLALEKCWVTQDYWFRMAAHHKLIPKGNYQITEFAGELALLASFQKSDRRHPPPRAFSMPTTSPIEHPEELYSLIDQNGKEHHCVPLKKERDKNGKNQTKRRTCFACKENSKTMICGQYCLTYGRTKESLLL
jgi:hypothetical protein